MVTFSLVIKPHIILEVLRFLHLEELILPLKAFRHEFQMHPLSLSIFCGYYCCCYFYCGLILILTVIFIAVLLDFLLIGLVELTAVVFVFKMEEVEGKMKHHLKQSAHLIIYLNDPIPYHLR